MCLTSAATPSLPGVRTAFLGNLFSIMKSGGEGWSHRPDFLDSYFDVVEGGF